MILTLNLRANIILSHQFDVDWTLNIELCLLGTAQIRNLAVRKSVKG